MSHRVTREETVKASLGHVSIRLEVKYQAEVSDDLTEVVVRPRVVDAWLYLNAGDTHGVRRVPSLHSEVTHKQIIDTLAVLNRAAALAVVPPEEVGPDGW